jgi:RNA polymerase sigma factor (sigma-70 family)
MLAVKEGSTDSLSLLYDRFSRRLFGFFYHLSSDGTNSEDMVQTVFMRIQKYSHSYRQTGNFESWIFNVARNVFHDYYKKNKRYQHEENYAPYERMKIMQHEETAEQAQIRKDEINMLHDALNQLNEENRLIIELTKFQQMKYAEVASITGLSESAVKVRIHRILKELRRIMNQKNQ